MITAALTLPSGQNTVEAVATDLGANGGNVTTKHYSLNVAAGASKTFTYDENGNCSGFTSSTAPPTTYKFDAEDRLVSVDCSPYRSEFSYDGFGRRVKIVEKFLGTETSTRQYVWCGTQLCEERDENNVVTKRFFAEGEQISGAKYFYTRDHLDSIRELTDATGAIRARYDYDPYGRRTKVQGGMDADFGFTGHYYHARSGLHLALYRAYDADIGRWINRDPIGEEGGLNLYGYVFANPVSLTDPLGLKGICAALEEAMESATSPQFFEACWTMWLQLGCGGEPPSTPVPVSKYGADRTKIFDPSLNRVPESHCPQGYRAPYYNPFAGKRGVFANPGVIAGSALAVSAVGAATVVIISRGRVPVW